MIHGSRSRKQSLCTWLGTLGATASMLSIPRNSDALAVKKLGALGTGLFQTTWLRKQSVLGCPTLANGRQTAAGSVY